MISFQLQLDYMIVHRCCNNFVTVNSYDANLYTQNSRKVYASFGGLLLFIEGSAKKLTTLKHEYIYLLMKK